MAWPPTLTDARALNQFLEQLVKSNWYKYQENFSRKENEPCNRRLRRRVEHRKQPRVNKGDRRAIRAN